MPSHNMLTILCDCGVEIKHSDDRGEVRCSCGQTASLSTLRSNYVKDGEQEQRDIEDSYQKQADEDREALNFVRGED